MSSQNKNILLNGESGKLTAEIKQKLDGIATELAANYCRVSFSKEEQERIAFTELFIGQSNDPGNPNLNHQARRNILIVGTGATYDLYNCVPLGLGLIEELYKNNPQIDETLVAQRFNDSRREFDLADQKPGFENTLSLFTQWHFEPNTLREEISRFVEFKYPPSLFYEVIAHMFKHSFIDVIINFNFDELLDNAIEEELGRENYFSILSDGDCVPLDDIMVDGRLKIPVYIKPHGTIKHKSSLRFTNRHYLEMPGQIRELLTSLFKGETKERKTDGNNNNNECNIPVNLFGVGFNMESIEFNKILNENLSDNSRVFHFMKEIEDFKNGEYFLEKLLPLFFKNEYEAFFKVSYEEDKTNEEFSKRRGILHEKLYQRIALDSLSNAGKDDGFTSPLCEMFSYTWRRVYDKFRVGFRPRSIGQHEIVSYLFYNPAYNKRKAPGDPEYYNDKQSKRESLKEDYDDNPRYFLDRTLVEIAISINRNDGIVELAQLLADRTGKYFALYRNKFEENEEPPLSIYNLIDQFKCSPDPNDFYSKAVFELDISILKDLRPKAENLLRKIENNTVVRDDFGRLKRWVTDDYRLVAAMLRIFIEISSPKENQGKEFNDVTPVVLYYLFISEHLSDNFINNFKHNYDKIVYNGKRYDDVDIKRMGIVVMPAQSGPLMINELVRLFDKSGVGAASYFSIHPKFNNPQNYLLESFTKSKVLHTNLALEYKFRTLFKQWDKWDHLLIISERTCLFDSLGKEESIENFNNKKIIIINSYESIRQYHKEELKKIDGDIAHKGDPLTSEEEKQAATKSGFRKKVEFINKKQAERYEEIVDSKLNEKVSIDVSCLPALQHNHHMMVFIKKHLPGAFGPEVYPCYKVEENGIVNYRLDMVGALYMYRSGFSNSVNPIFISGEVGEDKDDATNDFIRLLRIFSKIHRRAQVFMDLPESDDLTTDFKSQLKQII